MRIAWHGAAPRKKPAPGKRGEIATHVGKRIHQLRQEQQVSMRAVANGTGMSNAFICQLENGQSVPTVHTLWRLAGFFGVTMDFFMEGFEQ